MTPKRIGSDVGELEFWGCDCNDCGGNATHGGMRCDVCNGTNTSPLYIAVKS